MDESRFFVYEFLHIINIVVHSPIMLRAPEHIDLKIRETELKLKIALNIQQKSPYLYSSSVLDRSKKQNCYV